MVSSSDLRDLATLVALATVLAVSSLGARADVPWVAAPSGPDAASCELDEASFGRADVRAHPPGVERIAVPEVIERIGAGGVTLIDARSAEAFVRGHIPGAISLPADQAADLLAVQSLPIDPDHLIVTYCDAETTDADVLGEILSTHVGCREIRVLDGGFTAWQDAGAPVEPDHHG